MGPNKERKEPVAKRGRKKLLKGEPVSKQKVKETKQVKMSVQQQKNQKPVKKSVQQQKNQKPLMWEAYHFPEIEKQVDLERKWEQSLKANRLCPDFLNNQDNCTEMMFNEKIYHLENELSLKSDKYRNNKDWIKELYEVCQKEIEQTKQTLNKIYELKKYYKPILNKEDKKQNPNLTIIDQEVIDTFGLNPPLWIGGRNETAPHGCGSIPNQLLLKKISKKADISEGQYVAAFVILDQKMVELPNKVEIMVDIQRHFVQDIQNSNKTADLKCDGSWILARCIRPPEGRRKDYIIADIDDVDDMDDHSLSEFTVLGKALPHFRIPRKALIPLPLCIVDPKFNPEAIFPVGADVLALYKETTSFFPAVVEDTPKSVTDPYKLRFKDENQKIQNHVYLVLQKYVIEYQDVNKIFSKEEIAQLMYMKKIES